MSAPRSYDRALFASLCFGVGAGESARHKPLQEATAEACDIMRARHCVVYVYRRADGGHQASSLEPELEPVGPGAERILKILP